MTKLLITGGTGTVGTRVIEQLAGRDGVRALAHSDRSAERLAAAGVEVVRGSLGDPAALSAALEGVERLFLLSPYSREQGEQELGAIAAAEAAGVRHVVKLSSLLEGWDVAVMRGHREATAALRASAMGRSVLQPDNFMDNELGALDGLRAGAVVAPTGSARLAFVDARDIAAIAVAELTAPDPVGGDLVITGPEALSYAAYAERLGEVLGHPVAHVSPPAADFAAALRGFGLPAFVADDLTEMFTAMADAGATHPVTDTVGRVTGQPPRDARTWAQEVLVPALAVAH